jgi:hypothetical protein
MRMGGGEQEAMQWSGATRRWREAERAALLAVERRGVEIEERGGRRGPCPLKGGPTCQFVHLSKTRPAWLTPKQNHLPKLVEGAFVWFCKCEGVRNPVS